MNKPSTLKVLTLVAVAAVVVAAAYVLWQAWNASAVVVHPERVPIGRSPTEFGLDFETVSFETDDGLTLRGWFIPPTEPESATVITQPGYGGNRTSVITHTAMLARHGYGVLTFDWRNLGESEGEHSTVGLEEQLDVAAAMDWLEGRADVDPERIGALSQSAGAAAVIHAAAQDPAIRAVVAETTFASLQDMMDTGVEQRTGLPAFPFAPLVTAFGELRTGGDISEVRPVQVIGRIAPRPVLIIRAGRDDWVPAFNADELMAAAGEPKELWHADDAIHSKVMQTYPEEYERRVVGFFDEHLSSGGSR